ncbi:FmdE family protein [Oceanidesulfovibrio marinus]|uniref:Formylmethanofuran dehydrogenase n=1 Tax=Oceanidesulfovibrio marinus TaxID=370038 RepID=A0A6P1ZH80_9BACT|nr:FmdE family protein [Oceanidesulfovibrio marinus]QJT09559.1 formylmethanofuran dehydrogenase [Oceanidesulfovibrio marinus]TVM33769.1 formylmethanofuran dehydrogenase [Oceanidesulfovibrio marinus]
MPCTIDQQIIDEIISFHGHDCPGLTIGIRAAELALLKLGSPDETELVAVVETDMCGVDAIQFLTSCTYGKGNLIHKDYGKMAFNFYDRNTGDGFRALMRPDLRNDVDEEHTELERKLAEGTATEADKARNAELYKLLQQRFLDLPLEEMFEVMEPKESVPSPAQVLESLVCESCGEKTMESRTRRFGGKTLCIPCFNAVEQKV